MSRNGWNGIETCGVPSEHWIKDQMHTTLVDRFFWALAAVLLLGSCAHQQSTSRYDLVLSGGRVIDPETGLDAIRNVGIKDGVITTISTKSLAGTETLDVRGLVVSASSDAAMLERGEKKPPRGVRGGKSACGSGRKKPRRRSGRKTARPDVQLGHFSRIFRLIRCERPAVGAARSAVAFSRRASAPGAAARRAAPG